MPLADCMGERQVFVVLAGHVAIFVVESAGECNYRGECKQRARHGAGGGFDCGVHGAVSKFITNGDNLGGTCLIFRTVEIHTGGPICKETVNKRLTGEPNALFVIAPSLLRH